MKVTRAGTFANMILSNSYKNDSKYVPKRLISSTQRLYNNSSEVEKLNKLLKQKMLEIEAAEKQKRIDDAKPKLSDFKRPFLITFAIASTAYLTFHWAWWTLLYDEKEAELKLKLQEAEGRLQHVRQSIPEYADKDESNKNGRWYRKFKIWR